MSDKVRANTQIVLRPKISVCMATYNGESFISQQLRSILSQLSPDDEVIISDDSSTDRTLDIVSAFGDRRVNLYRGQTFHSPIYNFEHALKQATGEVIFLSDQDDEWVEGWVETALSELRDVSLVVCDAYVIDANGEILSSESNLNLGGERRPGVIHNLMRNGYVGCCCAFRREVLDVALPFPSNLPWHDWWIGLIADTFFTTKFIQKRKIRYRRHGKNFSPTGEGSTSTMIKKIQMRWSLGNALAQRWLKKVTWL